MPGLFPRLTPEGRRTLVIVTVVLGLAATIVAGLRRDTVASVIIPVTLALLVGVYLWSSGGGDDEGMHE